MSPVLGKATVLHPNVPLLRDHQPLLCHCLNNSAHSPNFISYLSVGASKCFPFAAGIIRLACACPEGISSEIPSNLIVRTA